MNLSKIQSKISGLFHNNLARDTLWMLLSKLFRVVIQAGYFIIIARVLGVENYGFFVSVTALASIIFPFVALGSEHVLIKYVSTNKSLFRLYWGNTLITLLLNGVILTGVVLLLSPLIFASNISLLSTLMILLADLIFLSLFDVSNKALMSVYLTKKAAQLGMLSTCIKLIAALSLAIFFSQPNIDTWATLYFVSSGIVSMIAICAASQLVGYPRPQLSKLTSSIKEGIYFAISASAYNINSSLDKTMLARLSNLTATGIYGSAYRFIDVGNILLLALFGASYTRFFKYGASGIRSSLGFAKRLLPVLLSYGIVSFIGYLIFAPLLPTILGEEYRGAIEALRWLAPLPAIAGLQHLAANTLTGAGHQKARSIIQVSAAILNIFLNLWLIPIYSWKGAAWATLISDSLRLLCLWLIVFWLARQAVQPEHQTL